ncbi:hypothetical protein FRC07_002153 [Ceratobasidium sp. 392]|nr:hypothetical protein FRC07_002153 [Ceratobasidium sp. 392]
MLAKNPTPEPAFITVPGLHSKKLTDVIYEGFTTNDPTSFHYNTFMLLWNRPGSTKARPVRISGEMYCSPAMIEAHLEVQTLTIKDASCTLPRCVAGFMFASDGLQFGHFANAKGWPIFGYFGNESKYEQCKPYTNACHHVAHIPSLSDEVQEQIAKLHGGKPPSDALITHLWRELMHETTSVHEMGGLTDMRLRTRKRRLDNEKRREKVKNARNIIYKLGLSIQNKGIEKLLADESYVPTMNAFSSQLGNTKFNIFAALVVDQLHEIELGVFKALFRHLVRILYLCSRSTSAVIEFDRRFWNVPTFSSSIRKFSSNVASMSRLAARDFEDILQCCGPVFKGLLPEECDEQAQKLLYLFAQWHGLAKLRLHTEATLKLLKAVTTQFGDAMRKFADSTKDLDIRETPKEYERRKRQAETGRACSRMKKPALDNTKDGDGRRRCMLNLATYKFHSMGDYVRCIERFGTCDSYSTQINELHNRSIKLQYTLTNKRNATSQRTEIGDIKRVLLDMMNELMDRDAKHDALHRPNTIPEPEGVSSLLSGLGYWVGQSEGGKGRIPSVTHWIREHGDDDATKFFVPQLKRHILSRILGSRDHPDFNDSELDNLKIHKDRMYLHKTLQLNYTAYDVVRQREVLNPNTAMRFIILPGDQHDSNNPDHPFLYAKILGIYHAKFIYKGVTHRMEFIHVRWLYYDYDQPGGLDTCRMDQVSYETCRTMQDVLDSFDFVDPADVIRASHLIPDFNSQVSSELLNGPSMALDNKQEGDWNYYYVNRFVDRDMLMWYIGGGVGHCWHIGDKVADALAESGDLRAQNSSEEAENEDIDNLEPNDNPEVNTELDLNFIEGLLEGVGEDEEEEYEEEEDEGIEAEDFGLESDLDEGEDVDEEWDDLFGF